MSSDFAAQVCSRINRSVTWSAGSKKLPRIPLFLLCRRLTAGLLNAGANKVIGTAIPRVHARTAPLFRTSAPPFPSGRRGWILGRFAFSPIPICFFFSVDKLFP